MGNLLYRIAVRPLVLIIELIYSLSFRLVGNEGIAIICVSCAVSALIAPLYKRADALQDEERRKQAAMARWTGHIRRTFKGDERYMMLQTYYRQQNYHPLMALRSSVSLLLQIPFFMAAYSYLSHLRALEGVPFLFIRDLSRPDALTAAGGVTINILPVAMTLINILSGAVYSRGLPLKSKIQMYGLAGVFLVLLYRSPAGLVLYWTMNNVISLARNLLKLFRARRTQEAAEPSAEEKRAPAKPGEGADAGGTASGGRIFLMGGIFLTILTGFLIPLSVINASPLEFMNTIAYVSPVKRYCVSTAAVWGGFLLLWGGIFYLLAGRRGRERFAAGMYFLSGVSLVNYFFFGRHMGTLTSNVKYDTMPDFFAPQAYLNLAALAAALAVMLVIWKKRRDLVLPGFAVLILASALLTGKRLNDLSRWTKEHGGTLIPVEEVRKNGPEGILTLSSKGKNVIVLMLDKAVSDFLPYMFNEKPELFDSYDGFVYYPDALSFGEATNTGSPALFGGYEYTPLKMNERKEELLKDKQNEALLVMPSVFGEAGWHVTVVDPPYANYGWVADLSIYKNYPYVDAYHAHGRYSGPLEDVIRGALVEQRQRSFVFYSLMKCVPMVLQGAVYDGGDYYTSADSVNYATSEFVDAYSVLCNLSYMTKVTDEETDQLLLMKNTATHEPTSMQLPDYEFTTYIDNEGLNDLSRFEIGGKKLEMEEEEDFQYYEVNMASLLKVADWLDDLKEKGVYDNTRIIIAADHGRYLGNVPELLIDEHLDAEACHPLLLVKDFDARGRLRTSDAFMTNADVPSLAFEGLIGNPVNPFTGNPVSTEEKEGELVITTSLNWDTSSNNGYTFDTSDGYWYSVHSSIWDKENWKRIGRGEKGIPAR